MEDFLDVNVWVALVTEDHPFHLRAAAYFRTEANPRVCFCRFTALGLVRVACQQNTLSGNPLTPREAWTNYCSLRRQQGIKFIQESPAVEELIGEWLIQGLATRKNWTDMYLAAFAVAGNLRMVSFDRDFNRFPGLDLLHLNADV